MQPFRRLYVEASCHVGGIYHRLAVRRLEGYRVIPVVEHHRHLFQNSFDITVQSACPCLQLPAKLSHLRVFLLHQMHELAYVTGDDSPQRLDARQEDNLRSGRAQAHCLLRLHHNGTLDNLAQVIQAKPDTSVLSRYSDGAVSELNLVVFQLFVIHFFCPFFFGLGGFILSAMD